MSARGIRKRLYLSFLAAAVVPTLIAGVIGIYYSLSALQQQTLHQLQREVDTGARGIALYFEQLGSVLRYIANSAATHELVLGIAASKDARRAAAALLQRDWLNLAASYPHLKQLRFLDRRGREVVRIDSRDGELRVVDEGSLQDKSDRYYFAETMALPAGGIFVSRLDLNEEYGRVEAPASPVIRLATPVSDPGGQPAGMLIINVDAQVMLRDLEKMVESRLATAFLFDPDGRFLERGANGDNAKFPNRPAQVFSRLYGEDTLARLRGGGGTLVSHGWIFAFSPLFLLPEESERRRVWHIALAYPESAIFHTVFNLYLLYAVLGVALLATACGGYALSRRLLTPLESLAREADAISAGDYSRRVPVRGDDEIADLGRAFNRMMEQLEHSIERLRQHQTELEAAVRQRTADLEHQRGRLSAIIAHTAEAIVACDDNGRVLLANASAERLLALADPSEATLAQGLGASWPILVSESKSWDEVRMDVGRAGRVLAVSATRLKNTPPRSDDLILVVRDVTEERCLHDERRDLDRQMFQMDKLATLGELVMGLAHEIGNPLAGMKAVVQSLREQPLPAGAAAALARLEAEIDRLAAFLRGFHGYAAPQALRIEPCILANALDDVLFWVRKEAQIKCIAITQDVPDSLPLLAADPAQLKQALLNLLVNAIAAMPDGGSLRISARAGSSGHAIVLIQDSGSGIPAERLERVFEPFFTTRKNGSGLGLPIVAKIVAHHRGHIRLSSRPGHGTTAELLWPVLNTEPVHE